MVRFDDSVGGIEINSTKGRSNMKRSSFVSPCSLTCSSLKKRSSVKNSSKGVALTMGAGSLVFESVLFKSGA